MRDILGQAIDELDGYRTAALQRLDPADTAFVITNGVTRDDRFLRIYGKLYPDEINPLSPSITEGFRAQRMMNLDGVIRFSSEQAVVESARLGGSPVRYRSWLQLELDELEEDVARLHSLRERFPALSPKVEVLIDGTATQLADGARIDSAEADEFPDPEKNPE